MKKNVVVIFFVMSFLYGCEDDYSSYSPYPSHHSYPLYPSYSSYSGFSSYIKKVKGTSNLVIGYKNPPVFDMNEPENKDEFERQAEEYLDGVANDLDEVNYKAKNAKEKIDAANTTLNRGLENFSVFPIGRAFVFIGISNFELLGYPQFPDFEYFSPAKPYNDMIGEYNRNLADFSANIKAYIEDGEHYLKNCKNDYEEIERKADSLRISLKKIKTD